LGGRWQWQRSEWSDWPQRFGCAWESSLHEGVMHTSSFSGRLAYRATVPPSFTSDGSDLENDDADGREVACGCASVRHGGKKLDVLTWQIRHDATLRHQICPPPCTCSALLSHIPFDASFTIDFVMHAMHSAAPPVYQAFHDTILNLFNTARSCLVACCLRIVAFIPIHFRKGMLLRAFSPVRFCSSGFVLDFVFLF